MPSNPNPEGIYAMAFSPVHGGIFLIVGDNTYTSIDGLNWHNHGYNTAGFTSIAAGAGIFVASNEGSQVHLSLNGSRWAPWTPMTGAYFGDVVFIGEYFYIPGSDNIVYVSADGTSWHQFANFSAVLEDYVDQVTDVSSITGGDGIWVATVHVTSFEGDRFGVIAVSYDGHSWSGVYQTAVGYDVMGILSFHLHVKLTSLRPFVWI